MRKGLSILIILTLVLSSFSMALAATPPDVVGQPSEAAVSVLMDLGVVNGYEDGTYKPERVVSRAEMAKLIIVALGLETSANAATSKFPDMAGATWAQGFVALASDLGIVLGYPDGTFKPSGTVTYDEAATMILRALGYTDKSLMGTWPTNYVVKAKLLGVLDGLSGKLGGANRGDIAEMLYNALTLDIGKVNLDGLWVADSGDTMLARLKAEVGLTSIINGSEDSQINLRPFIGAYANTYLNKAGDIISVDPVSEFLTGTYDGTVFTADGTDYTVSLTLAGVDKAYFDNGSINGIKPLSYFTGDDVTLAVELTGKTISKIYSIATWVATSDGLFKSSDASDISVHKTLKGSDFVLNTTGAIDGHSYQLVGVASLMAIAVDDVVYIYEDNLGKIRRVAVGTDLVSGTISKISSGGDYTIGGKVYAETAENVASTLSGSAGDAVKAYLDAYGDIYLMKITSGIADTYAIMLDKGNGTGSDLSGTEPAVRLFLKTGAARTFTVDETKTALKAEYFTNMATPKVWVTAPAAGTILKYGVDASDAVVVISESAGLSATSNITSKGYFNGYAIETDAAIFTYAGADYTQGDNYRVKSLNEVLSMTGVTAKYAVNPDTGKIAAMLLESGVTNGEVYGVVKDWATNESTSGFEVTFLVNGNEATYIARQAAYDTAAADNTVLYKLNFNLSGEVATLTPPLVFISVSDASTTDFVLTSGASTYTLDTDVVVYKWNFTKDVYEKGTITDIVNGYLYDVYGDTDHIYDIVILPPVI